MIQLIPHGNPRVDEIHQHARLKRKRGINKELLQPPYRGDVKFCAWCVATPLSRGQRKYCSEVCVTSSNVYFWPITFGLEYLLDRQRCACNLCGYDFTICIEVSFREWKEKLSNYGWITDAQWAHLKVQEDELRSKPLAIQVVQSKSHLPIQYSIEIDHVVPVALGGDVLGLENLQALCRDCHIAKTKIDLINIRRKHG